MVQGLIRAIEEIRKETSTAMFLSRWQFFCMMTALEVCMTIWLTISPAIQAAKQDAWISIIIGGMAGCVVALIMVTLSRLYPNLTWVQLTERLLGKWPGKVVVFLYFTAWYSVTAVIIRDTADFLQLVLFHQTPIYAIVIALLLLMLYMNLRGELSGIARFAEIVCPALLLVVLISLLLNIPNLMPELVRPIIAYTGPGPIMTGALEYASFLGETYFVLMLMPFLNKPERSGRDLMYVILTTTILVCMASLTVIMLFGPNYSGHLIYPFFQSVRFISIMHFIQNMDILVMYVWLFAVFLKLSMYMFICSYGTAQWLGHTQWKKLTWWFAAIVFLGSVLPQNIVIVLEYAQFFWASFVFPVLMVGFPMFLLLIGKIRKNMETTS